MSTLDDLGASLSDVDAVAIAEAVVADVGNDEATRRLHVSPNQLQLLLSRSTDVFRSDPTIRARLLAWARASEVMYRPSAGQPFDHLRHFWENYYSGPRPGPALARGRRPEPSGKFLDFELAFPFGVPACVLTPNSAFVRYFSERSFDLVTYKTVREQAWQPYARPQWAFAVDAPQRLHPDGFDVPVRARVSRDPSVPVHDISLVNSFGVPSVAPEAWQADVDVARANLTRGQVLVVSVMGSPENAKDISDLAARYARAAGLASETRAHAVELNLSCPNTEGKEPLCADIEEATAVIRAVERELRRSGKPLLLKLGYMGPEQLGLLLDGCRGLVRGYVATNTVPVPVVRDDGSSFFGERTRGGLSGSSIRALGLEMSRGLVQFREAGRIDRDAVVVGVGGVMTPSDFDAYMNEGVDAVQSCSGAWLNPNLAFEVQRAVGDPTGRASMTPEWASVLAAMAAGHDEVNWIEVAMASGISPDRARQAISAMVESGFIEERDEVIAMTPKGRRLQPHVHRESSWYASSLSDEQLDDELRLAISDLAG